MVCEREYHLVSPGLGMSIPCECSSAKKTETKGIEEAD